MYKLILPVICVCLLFACAEKPGGIIIMNEETIENFFEKDKQSWNPAEHLNLLIDQPVTEADIPPRQEGTSRLYGTLESNGAYTCNQAVNIIHRGSTFKRSEFGRLGQAGNGGNAWFYMDYNPHTGEIINARAYLYGFMGGVCDMRRKTGGIYGKITSDGFYLNINGPCLFPQVPGSTMSYALFIEGKTDLLNNSENTSIPITYIIDNTGKILSIPASPQTDPYIYDSGDGTAWVN